MPGYLTVKQMLDKSATSIREEDVPFCGGLVKVRGLTAAEDAQVTEASLKVGEGRNKATKFRADIRQELMLLHGLVEPSLGAQDVKTLIATTGADEVGRLIAKIEELSGTSEEDREAAAVAFPGPA